MKNYILHDVVAVDLIILFPAYAAMKALVFS